MSQATKNKEQSTKNKEQGDPEVLVKVENVSKIFCRDLKKSLLYGLKDSVGDLFSFGKNSEDERSDIEAGTVSTISNIQAKPFRALREGEFWANKDISFELRRGECLGLIGGNGAGKTTLLKMLNGLIKPDTGRIEMRGRVGALIALGAGFNPILTGRENIYINGSVLGLSKAEIDEKIDDIIDFAEISEFIDSPVQTYSSGMQVRLGFAVATAMNPDILILDEVLAVGDIEFRAKCFKRIGEMTRKCAVIFVSHDLSQMVRICDRAMVIDSGQCVHLGSLPEAVTIYKSGLKERGRALSLLLCETLSQFSVSLPTPDAVIGYGESIELVFQVYATEEIEIGLSIANLINDEGMIAGQLNFSSIITRLSVGRNNFSLKSEGLHLSEGKYTVNIVLFKANKRETALHAINCTKFRMRGEHALWASYLVPVKNN